LLPTQFWNASPELLLENTEEYSAFGQTFLTFSSELLLVFLCAHASKHVWSRINWITDIAQVVDKGNINWMKTLALAEQTGATRMLLLGIYLTSFLPGYQPNNQITQLVDSDQIVRKLGDEIMERFLSDPCAPQVKEFKTWIVHASLKEHLFERLKLLFSNVTKPTLDEWCSRPNLKSSLAVHRSLRLLNLLTDPLPKVARSLLSGKYDKNFNLR